MSPTFSFFLSAIRWLLPLTLAMAPASRANDQSAVDGLTLNDSQIAALGLRLAPLQPIERVAGYAWPAMVDIPLAHRDMLSAPVTGRISEVLVVHGEVSKSQPILSMQSAELVQRQKDYLDTLVRLNEARAAFQRAQRLRTAGSASEKQYLAAKTRFDTLKHQKAAQRQELAYIGLGPEQVTALETTGALVSTLVLRAPKDGLLFELQVERNQRVSAQQPLAHIGEISEVVVDVDMPLDALDGIQTGTVAQIDGTPWQGRVAFIGQQADPATQRVTVHVRFDNPERQLLPGRFVRVRFIRDDLPSQRVYRIPTRALVSGENGETIAFVKTGAQFLPQPIEVIERDDKNAIVMFAPEVPPTAQVVAFGAIFLKGMLAGEEGGEAE